MIVIPGKRWSRKPSLNIGLNLHDRLFDGLVGAWTFQEGEGLTAHDMSGYGNHGTLVNGPTWVTTEHGWALDFDGVDDYVDCGASSIFNLQDTISVVVLCQPTSVSGLRNLVDKHQSSIAEQAFVLRQSDNDFYFWLNFSGVGWQSVVFYDVISVGTWYLVSGVFNGERMQIFVNSDEGSSNAISGTITTNNVPVSIGAQFGGSESFEGNIASVLLYSRALTSEEIKTLYELTMT